MKKFIIFLSIVFCLRDAVSASFISPPDSLGLITENGNKYIVHEVDAGETLFALSRKYGIEVQAIKDANSESVTTLTIGQKVRIPVKSVNKTVNGKYHIVKPSETLYSVSRQYEITVDELVRWNNLIDNNISIGQELIVSQSSSSNEKTAAPNNQAKSKKTHTVAPSETLYSLSRLYAVTMDQLRSWNNLSTGDLYIGQILIVSENPESSATIKNQNSSMLPINKEDVNSKPTETSKTVKVPISASPNINDEKAVAKPSEKVVQKGFAEVIENTNETKKYLALHKTAPPGTIMQVRNDMNNQSVFVRIVGTIPEAGDNSKVILKISKKAYDRLGAVDSRFPVEISYMP